jgi:hypothetical protein
MARQGQLELSSPFHISWQCGGTIIDALRLFASPMA